MRGRRVFFGRRSTCYERLKFSRERKRILALFAQPVNFGCSAIEVELFRLRRRKCAPIRRDYGSAA